ncbi:MAG: hypothetical protein ACO3G4_04310, partial [Opitutaceae bacterium]
MDHLLVLAFFLLLLGVFLVWGRAHQRRIAAQVAALASRQGLTVVAAERNWLGASPCVEGERRGRRIRFWSYATGAGKSRRHWIATAVAPRAAGTLAFELQPQGLGTRLAELFGAKEITVGDAAFDAAWFVRTNQPATLGALLLPEIRTRLLQLRTAGGKGTVQLTSGWIQYAEEGHFGQEKAVARLEQVLPALEDLADAVEV